MAILFRWLEPTVCHILVTGPSSSSGASNEFEAIRQWYVDRARSARRTGGFKCHCTRFSITRATRSGQSREENTAKEERRQRHAICAGSADMGSPTRGKRHRSGAVLHAERRSRRGDRLIRGGDHRETRLRNSLSLSGGGAGEKRLEEAGSQILSAVSGHGAARR